MKKNELRTIVEIEKDTLEDVIHNIRAVISICQQYDLSEFTLNALEECENLLYDIHYYMNCYPENRDIIDITDDIKDSINLRIRTLLPF